MNRSEGVSTENSKQLELPSGSKLLVSEQKATIDQGKQTQQLGQQQRKRRQIVAINSLTQQMDSNSDVKSNQNTINMFTLQQQQQQMMVNNQMNFNNSAINNPRNPMMPMNNSALFGNFFLDERVYNFFGI